MISYKIEDFVDTTIEEGIWLDFIEQTWIFFIKDTTWADEEIQLFRRHKIHLSYFQKGIVDGFLMEVNDVIETSDIPFCILDATKEFLNTLKDNQCYSALFLLINSDNKICARKEGGMSLEVCQVIKSNLREQRMNDYDEKAFSIALTKMQNRYEPYELEEFVKTTQDF